MKKKTLAAILLGVCALSLCAVGCGKDDGKKTTNSLKGVKYTDVPADCSVEIFEPFSFDTAAISYEGKIYTPTVTVKYGDETVTTKNKSFIVEKLGEYTVTFVFDLPKGQETYTTKVTCVDTVAPTVVTETEITGKVEFGSTVTVPTFGVRDASGETITPTVEVYAGEIKEENLVAVKNGQFTVNSYEKYTYRVAAEDSSGNKTVDESFGFVVRQEGEFEFFNSQEYTSSALSVWADGQLEYVTDPAYVFEGEGALKYTTGGKWPDMRFSLHNQYVDVANVKAITYWVYNASAYNFRLDFAAYPTDTRSGTIIARSIAYAGVWTLVTVDCSSLADIFDPETMVLGIGMNGSDHNQNATFEQNATKDYYSEMEVYIDAMTVHYETPEWDYSLAAPELTYYNGSTTTETVPVLTAGNVTGVDISEVQATLKGEDGIGKKLKVQNGEFVIPNQIGKYTVHYFYKNGTQGFSVTQNVKIVEGYKTVKTYVDYEDEELNLDVSYIGLGSGALSLSTEQVKQGKQSLKFENGLYSRWSAIAVKFSDEALAMLDENRDSISFSMYIDKGTCDATQYNVRVRDIGQSVDSSNLAYWLTYENSVETGKWLSYTCSDARVLTKIKEEGGIWFHVEIIGFTEGVEGDKIASRGYKLYLDDIRIVNNYKTATNEDFEGENVRIASTTVTTDALSMSVSGGTGSFFLLDDAYSGNSSIGFNMTTTSWTQVGTKLTLGKSMREAIDPQNTMVSFRLKLVPSASENTGVATGAAATTYAFYNLRFFKATAAVSNTYGIYDNVQTGVWMEFFINDSVSLTQLKEEGTLNITVEVKQSTLTSNYGTLLIDAVEVITGMGDGNETFTNDTSFDAETYQLKVNNGTLSAWGATGTTIGQESLMLENSQDQAYTTVAIKIPESAKKGTTRISLMLNINPHGCNATSYNVRIRGANGVEGSNSLTGHTSGKGWVAYVDTAPTRTWLYYELTDAEGIAAIVACDYLVVAIEMKGNTTENYRLNIDNIRFENESEKQVTPKVLTLTEMLADQLPEGATVNETTVKNAAGETVTLTDGKFPEAGEYLVTVKLTVDGVTAIYEFKVNV